MGRVRLGTIGAMALIVGTILLISLIAYDQCDCRSGASAPATDASTTSSAPAASFVAPAASSVTVPSEPTDRVLTFYTSKFKTDVKDARAHNISLGAKKLDGSVMMPGSTFSFNEVVGPRTEENGFKKAPVLIMGEIFQDVGGGMCQVSSTLFAATLKAVFTIKERHPHSRPSSYMPRGFDATVNYPKQCWSGDVDPNVCFDLKLKNPYDFPVMVRTSTDVEAGELTVQLWGPGDVAKVETRWVTYAMPTFEKRWRRGWKPGTWKKRKQNGRNGLRGALMVNVTWPDGKTEKRTLFSDYKPVDEIWYVGRDWEGDDPWR